MAFELVLFAAIALFLVWTVFPSDKRLREQGEGFAERNQAYVDGEFVRAFDRASKRQDVAFATLYLTGAAGTLLLRSLVEFDSHLFLILTGATSWMGWAAVRLRIAGREFSVPVGRAVTARARRVTLADYLPRAAMALTWATAALTGAFAVLVAAWWRQGNVEAREAAPVVAGGVLACVFALVAFLVGRAMCDRPQASVDACHLYVQDALRAEALSRVHVGVCWMGMAVGPAASSAPGVADLVGRGFPLLFVSLFLPFVAFRYVARTNSWYRQRLWPTLTPGQVLMPGDPVPPRIGVPA